MKKHISKKAGSWYIVIFMVYCIWVIVSPHHAFVTDPSLTSQQAVLFLVNLSVTSIKMTHHWVPHVHYNCCDHACVWDKKANYEQGQLIATLCRQT